MDDRVVVAVVALILYVLWRRGVITSAWGALWGPSQRKAMVLPLLALGAGSGAVSGAGGPVAATSAGRLLPGNILAAENAVTATRPNWLNACLQWVDDVRARTGQHNWYGLDYAGQVPIEHSDGIHAPAGSVVIVAGNPGHIGISNGDGTYNSVGIGASEETLAIPAYAGWTA